MVTDLHTEIHLGGRLFPFPNWQCACSTFWLYWIRHYIILNIIINIYIKVLGGKIRPLVLNSHFVPGSVRCSSALCLFVNIVDFCMTLLISAIRVHSNADCHRKNRYVQIFYHSRPVYHPMEQIMYMFHVYISVIDFIKLFVTYLY